MMYTASVMCVYTGYPATIMGTNVHDASQKVVTATSTNVLWFAYHQWCSLLGLSDYTLCRLCAE